MSSTVKHQYAFDSEREEFIDVKNLEKKDRKRKFICLDCGAIVTPFMGEIQQRHFRHKPDHKLGCSGESQLHFSTKTAFLELYNNAIEKKLEFIIEYNVKEVCNRYESDNLTPCSLGTARDRLYERRIIESVRKGYTVDNCFICQYHREEYINDIAGHVYCDSLYGCFDSNKAVSCSNYEINSAKIESGQDSLSKDDLNINDLVEYIGGAIKYRNGAGRIIKASHGFYKCEFNGKLTEWLSRKELSLIE